MSDSVTDQKEASAFAFANNITDIYSNSWGPDDVDLTVDGPGPLARRALQQGTQYGRHGLGNIYVFASGNGGARRDNCNFDGYANSIYTITIGAIDFSQRKPAYSEECSSLVGVTYSSGENRYILTSDWNAWSSAPCSHQHGGTSAAAPVAVGVLALVLSARPDLTWRDVLHLCVESAIPVDVTDPDWSTTGSGRKYSHKYGFGRLDAYAIVEKAKTWKTVGPFVRGSEPRFFREVHLKIPQNTVGIFDDLTVDPMTDASILGIKSLEYVEVTVDLDHEYRGDLEINLVSPKGTVSKIATARPIDRSKSGLRNWTFTTIKCWGEPMSGTWRLQVRDQTNLYLTGTLKTWQLAFHGQGYRDDEPRPAPPQSSTISAASSSTVSSASESSSTQPSASRTTTSTSTSSSSSSTTASSLTSGSGSSTSIVTDTKSASPLPPAPTSDVIDASNGTRSHGGLTPVAIGFAVSGILGFVVLGGVALYCAFRPNPDDGFEFLGVTSTEDAIDMRVFRQSSQLPGDSRVPTRSEVQQPLWSGNSI